MILGYKDKDINNLSDYSKEITKSNLNKDKELKQKDITIESKQNTIDVLMSIPKCTKKGI